MIGAMMPIEAYDGRRPMKNVPTPIKVIVMMKVYLRPTMSPRRPKTRAPKGRTAKPAAKARSVKMKAAVGFTPEKNCAARMGASVP